MNRNRDEKNDYPFHLVIGISAPTSRCSIRWITSLFHFLDWNMNLFFVAWMTVSNSYPFLYVRPGSSRLYRLVVWQAQKPRSREMSVRGYVLHSVCRNFLFSVYSCFGHCADYQSINPSIHPSIHPSVRPSSIHPSIHLGWRKWRPQTTEMNSQNKWGLEIKNNFRQRFQGFRSTHYVQPFQLASLSTFLK